MEVADHELRRVVNDAFEMAVDGLTKNSTALKRIIDSLVDRGSLAGAEVRSIVLEEGGPLFCEESVGIEFDEQVCSHSSRLSYCNIILCLFLGRPSVSS